MRPASLRTRIACSRNLNECFTPMGQLLCDLPEPLIHKRPLNLGVSSD
jgi:hypothetical protein